MNKRIVLESVNLLLKAEYARLQATNTLHGKDPKIGPAVKKAMQGVLKHGLCIEAEIDKEIQNGKRSQ